MNWFGSGSPSSSSLHWKMQTDNPKLTSAHPINVYMQVLNMNAITRWIVQHQLTPPVSTIEDFNKVSFNFLTILFYFLFCFLLWGGFHCLIVSMFYRIWDRTEELTYPSVSKAHFPTIFMVNKENDRQQRRKKEHIEISRTPAEWKLNFPCW